MPAKTRPEPARPKPRKTPNPVWDARVAWVREHIAFLRDAHIPRLSDPRQIRHCRWEIDHERAILWAGDVVDAALALVEARRRTPGRRKEIARALDALAKAVGKRQRPNPYPDTPETEGGKTPMPKNAPAVPAEAHSDDRNVEVDFDAAPWFAQASDKDILALAECGFGGDYPADEVARFFTPAEPRMDDLFRYLEIIRADPAKKDCCGFECHVDHKAALAWIKANRPAIAEAAEELYDES